ncbi:MAG: pyridoxal-phosphate dependent enzyme, partial [Romboutsia sp.]|nr:pyridoxal-phosphate dependent enzyme [Romboutsia sp.]
KAINPKVKIVGVQTSNIPSMKASLENKKVTSAFNDVTMADGIAVKTPGDLTFNTIKDLIDEIIVVDEEEIAQAMVFLIEYQKVIAEGAGAVSTAAIWSGKYQPKKDENVVCIISGGNVDINTMYRIIDMGLNKCGRRFTFKTHVEDRSGGLSQVTAILKELNANILNAYMSKMNSKYGIGKQLVELTIETFNIEHKNEIVNALINAGFEVYIGE